MIRKITLTYCFALSTLMLSAQSLAPTVLATAGNYAKNGEYRLSYTIGELIVSTVRANSGEILTQGFHQGANFYLGLPEENLNSDIQIEVFPNPVFSTVNIRITGENYNNNCTVEVYDIFGRKINIPSVPNKFQNGETISLDLSGISVGNYFLRIVDTEKMEVFSDFKILKIN